MTDQDYIKAAVELADGWTLKTEFIGCSPSGCTFSISFMAACESLDALSAQLVRQVVALEGYSVGVGGEFDQANRALVYGPKFKAFRGHVIAGEDGLDRTMNTIKAIVDSGVLDRQVLPAPVKPDNFTRKEIKEIIHNG